MRSMDERIGHLLLGLGIYSDQWSQPGQAYVVDGPEHIGCRR